MLNSVASGNGWTSNTPRWQLVHGELVGIAKRRSALDAEEARWLREAEQIQIWKPLGMVSMLDYLERTLGYAPRTGHDRLRVARALGDLPELTEALASGELAYSAIRELVRVATPGTEAAWRDRARSKSLREIETLVAGHRPGDMPDDPPDDQARLHRVTFEEIDAATFALMRQARQALDEEHGTRMSDSEVLAAMAAAIVDGAPSAEHTGRARNQIAYTVCRACDRTWQEGAGVQVPVDHATLEQARCNAQHIGSLDAATPERATQDIPPATVRFIWRRDGGVCQTPGCRSARGLEIHHIVARADGGGHEPSNLTLRCGACHAAHHRGVLTISGTAPDAITTVRNVPVRDVPVRNVPVRAGSNHAPSTQTPTHSRAKHAATKHSTAKHAAPPNAAANHAAAPPNAAANHAAAPPNAAANHAAAPPNAAANHAAAPPNAAANHAAAPSPRNAPTVRHLTPSISPKYEAVLVRADLMAALTASGWRKEVVAKAIDDAIAHVGIEGGFEALLRESFRRCTR